jgi:hypothetical protein
MVEKSALVMVVAGIVDMAHPTELVVASTAIDVVTAACLLNCDSTLRAWVSSYRPCNQGFQNTRVGYEALSEPNE